MDFDDYVAARRPTLVRAAVLLGLREAEAVAAADRVLLAQARRIRRSADPDPVVLLALATLPLPEQAEAPEGRGWEVEARRALALLPPDQRRVAVLAHLGHLPPAVVADGLSLPLEEVRAHEQAVLAALAARDDDEARALVLAACAAVTVPWLPPLAEPATSGRRRVLVLAAAALAVAGVVSLVVAGDVPDEALLADDQVPSLYGYDVSGAGMVLRDRGLEVDERRSPSCDPLGTVVGTDPPTGAEVAEGDTVTLLTASPADYTCMTRYADRFDAWEFLGFAAGREPPPPFAGEVDVLVDGSGPVTLTADEAGDPDRWGDPSVLTALDDALRQVARVPGTGLYRTPSMLAVREVPTARCGIPVPAGLAGREALAVTLTLSGRRPPCPLTVDLYLTGEAIDTVALYTAGS